VARLDPLRALRYNPAHVKLGGVLAPPYDVISPGQRDDLYGRDLRNIVRIDFGVAYPEDVAGASDRYTRAAAHLAAWLRLDILVRDPAPAFYATTHEFIHPDGSVRRRRGLFGRALALPWDRSELRPHERTLRAPKEDRLALLRATGVQTSPVFVVADGAASLDHIIDETTAADPLFGGRTDGELGSEKHLLWRIDDPRRLTAIMSALQNASLYVADGHHRYETAVAYAAERRATTPDALPDADFAQCLLHVVDRADPALTILPTHRLVHPGHGVAFSLDDLWARLDDAFDEDAVDDVSQAMQRIGELHATHHAYAVVAHGGVAVLRRDRRTTGSPRQRLDAVVLEDEVLAPAGVDRSAIEAGALAYTRNPGDLASAVRRGDAVLGFGLNPVTVDEVIAVAGSGETMPQKSTYFYPKVPTGLVMSPL